MTDHAPALDAVLDHALHLISGLTLLGTVDAVFAQTGWFVESYRSDTSPAGDACFKLVQEKFRALSQWIQDHPTEGAFLHGLSRQGFHIKVSPQMLVLRADQEHVPLGARLLPGAGTTDHPRMPEVLGALAHSMEPGTHCIVADASMSMHARMQVLASAPRIDELTDAFSTRGRSALFPLRLYRLPGLALLADTYKVVAWMVVAE